MSRYQFSKLVMEKCLRRSFYDAVLELYETVQGTRIISVSLEGNLSLVVNKDEKFIIKLNEIAQRADDREDHQPGIKAATEMKVEGGVSKYIVKEEEFLSSTSNLVNEGIRPGNTLKHHEKFAVEANVETGKAYFNEPKYKFGDSDADSDSEEDADSDLSTVFQTVVASSETHTLTSNKVEAEQASVDDICFLPVGKVDAFKRKYDYIHDQLESSERKSSKKSARVSHADRSDQENRAEDGERTGGISSLHVDDARPCSPQLLPHTATGPVITEEDSGGCNAGLSESQIAQLAVLQMREPMFRQQDLEELARQQQQWQMVAYQRSFLENSYLQQYQRDTGRLRWDYSAQNKESTPHLDDAEKIFREMQSPTTTTEAVMLTATATHEQTRKLAREESDEAGGIIDAGRLSSQHLRFLAEEQHIISQLNAEYEEGELRTESYLCVLCGVKYSSSEHLLRHMEKHRVDFERSCSVCQSGTLTGNMLILHMEASHGPETSLPLPASVQTASSAAVGSSVMSATDLQLSFPSSLHLDYSDHNLEDTAVKHLPQQQSSEQIVNKVEEADDQVITDCDVKDLYKSFHYALGASTSKVEDDAIEDLQQDNFLGMPSQFCSLIGCQVCGEKFALSDALDEHVATQHPDTCCSYSCKPCSLSFSTHMDYSKHMTRHEASSTSLKCSHCLKSFKSVKQLRLHHVTAHACCHFCEYCRAGFPDAMSLQLHEQLHTLDPDKLTFRCDICNKAFYTQSQCSAHKRTHKDEKAHACDVCGSAFFKRGDLTKHVRNCTFSQPAVFL
ncbi:unnamed protein product [Candidula unifasciata]|uniref:C2H2-type domain-containing protein n=1 Tax=Candidula unifasciata TaxID=100452 RepID=A0A8S3Z3D4_9EUPU|nr:unnamed protein product [Candidula unifasciata]